MESIRRYPLRHLVFWPTFTILLMSVIASIVNLEGYLSVMRVINSVILINFSWFFSLGVFLLMVLIIGVFFSPLGNIRIGGMEATPLISRWRWFMMTLSTTTAVGILFWTTAEPLFHIYEPPISLGIVPGSAEAQVFSMATMFLHWTYLPYSIYTVPSLVAALIFYNRRRQLSIAQLMAPLLGDRIIKKFGGLIDTLGMFALVAGVASTLGTGGLTISGGVAQYIGGNASTPLRLGIVIGLIVLTFIISAASGLYRGLSFFASLNIYTMIVLGIFLLIAGPTLFMFMFGVESFGAYLDSFFTKSLFTGAANGDDWPHQWSIYYWTVWFAAAPVTALFLGKIGKGYTVREFILYTMIYPATFCVFWLFIFTGSTIYFDSMNDGMLYHVMQDEGIEHVLYTVLKQLPLSYITIGCLLFIAFMSFVTSADASTDAIGVLSSKNFTAEGDIDGNPIIKIAWGIIIGVIAWVMVAFVGIEGIKMLANLGGLPGAIITLMTGGTLFYWMLDYRRIEFNAKYEKRDHNREKMALPSQKEMADNG